MTASVRVIARGMNGHLLFEGSFGVLVRELSEEGSIDLTLGDRTRRVTLRIPWEILEEVEGPPSPEALRERARRAEDGVIDRLNR